ncbi:MFS transporter, MHS family, proline/betaine transporter [Micromonospora rhizosphaerae]|uniref:Putative proline/betaine transporter n=1 Tax=Micromonospora rhizosphaerae TaxID=568872 RepID=A0A1C6SBL8_9ACTN|nr:MFS transporter [Micromonospora rhizosphaerae]SCL26880.1 MFS transporter, MHS family, proline/betaine transporter [Micromonospora rhizosphaerae]
MTQTLTQPSPPTADPSTLKRAVIAGVIGHFVEWYDYGVYAYVATTLAVVFFSSSNPTAALLAVFATFAVAFFARPLGGLFFGSLGDRIGRQRCLATVVVLMSLSTFAIGVLPTYTSVGVLAPVLLLTARLLQGFSAGGEIAGAASFINEYAPGNRRGLLSSLLPAASATGLLFGAVLMAVLTANLSKDGMNSWGWRVPFLIALPLGMIGLYLRLKIEDTPMFRALVSAAEADPAPLRSSVTGQFKWIAVAFGATLTYGVGFYVVMSYMPTYLKGVAHFDTGSMLAITSAALITHIVALPLWGALSDRVGRKPVLIGASVALVVVTYPAFLFIAQGGVAAAITGGATLGALIAAGAAPLFAYMAEMFPTRVRASSVSIGYNASVMIFGGTAPFIATYLIDRTGSQVAPSFYLVAAAAGAALTLALAPTSKSSHQDALRQS